MKRDFHAKNGVGLVFGGDVYGSGMMEAIAVIDSESFVELARAMMKSNPNAAVKAFGSALADGF